MSLSPWDLSGNISFDFSLYRPRRPSYVFATQIARRRNESYRHATKSDSNSGDTGGLDFIEGIVRKKRKDSYKAATQHEEIEMGKSEQANHISTIPEGASVSSLDSLGVSKVSMASQQAGGRGPQDDAAESVYSAAQEELANMAKYKWKYGKNLVILTISFILVFTAFRSIQNLQSSLNTSGRLGVIAMGCVHGTMFLTCLFAPVLINKLTSKWTIVLGLLFYLFWVAANFYPHIYTLVPTSIGVGFGQSLAWGAQVTYIQKLAVDYAHASRELTQQEMYKFNGVFLACFQTSHIWGNLVSSLMLGEVEDGSDMGMGGSECGVGDRCREEVPKVWNISHTGTTTKSQSGIPNNGVMGAWQGML